MEQQKKEELKRILYHELKLYRFISYYFGIVGCFSLASPFLFRRSFSGPEWTAYSIVLAGAFFAVAYALHSFKEWAMPVAICMLLCSGFGQLYFNPLATYSVFVLPAVISVLLIHQHLKLVRLTKQHRA